MSKIEQLKTVLNRHTENEELTLKSEGTLILHKEGKSKMIGEIRSDKDKTVYYKMEDEKQIHVNSNSWSVNRIIAHEVDEIIYETDKAIYSTTSRVVKSQGQTFEWDTKNGLDKKYYLPLDLWKTVYKDPLANNLIPLMGTEWFEVLRKEFQKDYMKSLAAKLKTERLTKIIYPESDDIFRAFKLTPLSKVKVLIIGQDPYHDGNASGLAFHPKTDKYPPSFININKEVEESVYGGFKLNPVDMEDWAYQGVFLLNTTLTVERGLPGSHFGWGWETFTKEVIRIIVSSGNPLVVILWGQKAFNVFYELNITNANMLVLHSVHPSPLSANKGFFGNEHFLKCNAFLTKHRIEQIVW